MSQDIEDTANPRQVRGVFFGQPGSSDPRRLTTQDGSVRYRCHMQRSLQTTTPDISGVRLLH